MSGRFLLFVLIGKVLVYLGQHFPPLSEAKNNFIRRLFSCDLCLGVWIYTALAFFLQIRLFEDVYFYVPLLTDVITGAITSFIVHLAHIGWKEKFEAIVF